MAIFLGSWKDGAGVPFDPGGFELVHYGPGGVARVKRAPLRNSAARQRCIDIFTRISAVWSLELDPSHRLAWDLAAEGPLKETRSGTFPSLTAHAFFQRCVTPAEHVAGSYREDDAEFPVINDAAMGPEGYDVGAGRFNCSFKTHVDDLGDPDTGIAMFQIHPWRALGANEVAFTNLISWITPLPTDTDEHLLQGVGVWPVPEHLPARAMVRRWNRHAFHRTVDTYTRQ